MRIKKAFRYRLYPNRRQRVLLALQFGHARFVYNWGLYSRKAHYREHGKVLSFYQLKRMLTGLKGNSHRQWLKEADSQVLQEKLRDLDRAYTNFFEGRCRYPTLKSKRDRQSIRYPQRFKFCENRTYLPKVGWVPTVFHRTLEGTAKSVTVTKTKSGYYYLSILCEVEMEDPQPHKGSPVGIDLGVKHFAVLSTTEKVDFPHHLCKAEARLKKLQRRHSRKKKGSSNREKSRVKLARAHEGVAHKRKDFLDKLSSRLVHEHSHINIENLNVSGMLRNHSLAKSISDAGWGVFGRMLAYKGQWYGSEVERIDRFYPSSKTCSECGCLNNELELHHRFWVCPGCGTAHDRDVNASVNILNCETTGGEPGSNACGEYVRRGGFHTDARRSQKQEAVGLPSLQQLTRCGSWL